MLCIETFATGYDSGVNGTLVITRVSYDYKVSVDYRVYEKNLINISESTNSTHLLDFSVYDFLRTPSIAFIW